MTAFCYHCTLQSPRPCSPPPDHPHPAITHQQGITRRSAAKRPRPCNTSSPLPVRSPYPAGKPPPPSAHTPPSLQLSNFPTFRLPNKSTNRKAGKLASRKVGKRTTNHTPPGSSPLVSWPRPPHPVSALAAPLPHPHPHARTSRGAPPACSPYPPGRPNTGVTPSYPVENVQCNRQRQMPGTDRTCRPGNQGGRTLSSKTTPNPRTPHAEIQREEGTIQHDRTAPAAQRAAIHPHR